MTAVTITSDVFPAGDALLPLLLKGWDFTRERIDQESSRHGVPLSPFRATRELLWKYVVFNWNDSETEIEMAVRLAREAKVDILSFWLGDGTPEEVSTRFTGDPYFRTLGSESWKGREIDFRK